MTPATGPSPIILRKQLIDFRVGDRYEVHIEIDVSGVQQCLPVEIQVNGKEPRIIYNEELYGTESEVQPILDFGGSNRYWKTSKDHFVLIDKFVPSKKLWKGYLLDDAGQVLAKINFDENGRNVEYGDLMKRKPGFIQEGWPTIES